MNQQQKQRRLKKLLTKIAPDHQIESLVDSGSGLESAGRAQADEAGQALESLTRGKQLDTNQMRALEAIILPGQRPVIDIKDDRYLRPQAPFKHLHDQTYRDRIEPAITAIGRVELPNHPSLPYGGTAFLVGDQVMMTNRHVAEIFATGVGREGLSFRGGLTAGVDLKQEVDSDESEAVLFDVNRVLMIHPFWDMALLSVSGLDDIQPLKLSTVDPQDLNGSEVAVIGYPALDPRNEIDLQNEIFRGRFNVKRMQPGKIGDREVLQSFGNTVNSITHDSSTLGGNSGSAVVDVTSGHVVALHFAGRYLEANYAVPGFELGRDRYVVEAGVQFVGDVCPSPTPWDSAWERADGRMEGKPVPTPTAGHTTAPGSGVTGGPPIVAEGTSVTWSIPFQVTVQIGHDGRVVDAQPKDAGTSSAVSLHVVEEERLVEPLHDTDYDNRQGYDEDFLGIKVRLPWVKKKKNLARTNSGEHVIPYHHFSVVLNKNRRLAFYTASNIDGRDNKRKPEAGKKYTRKALAGMEDNDHEKWFNDPRIPSAHQLPNAFYDKDRKAFDKGHLVRRDDVTWGDSYKEIMHANGDTFHVTNCSPQVAGFNRSNRSGIWGKLENEILKQARRDDDKYSVFSGPVLKRGDRIFHGAGRGTKIKVKIPTAFWKIIVVNNDNVLESYAFLMDQDVSTVDFDDERELAFGDQWKQTLISIEDLEKQLRTIRFPKELHRSDMFSSMI